MLNITKSNTIIPDPETLMIKPFHTIWESDKSSNKINALRIFAYIYFKHNPKSNYLKSATGKELDDKLKVDIIQDKDWKPNKDVTEAEKIYKHNMSSSGMKLLLASQKAISMISFELNNFTFDNIKDPKERMDVMSKLLTAIDKVDSAATNITSAQKRLEEEHLSKVKQQKKHLTTRELPPSQR